MLPESFTRYTEPLMGEELWELLRRGFEEEPPVSIRLNPLKAQQLTVPQGIPVPWCQDGWYLSERPSFTFDPLLHAGVYYVQEASSMFLDTVLRQYVKEPVRMLDLCAAPGGKSTVALAALPKGSLLMSNEPVRKRAQVLTENIQKFGHVDVMVTNNYPHHYARSGLLFDVILTDVPCSGEGMFRKDPAAIGEWSEQNVERCWRLQREIVTDAWQCLRPGGLLIYSTCTFNEYENERNVRFIQEELGADVLPVSTDPQWQITGSLLSDYHEPVYRFIPGKSRGEGLFMAVLRKNGERSAERVGREKGYKTEKIPSVVHTDWLWNGEDFDYLPLGEKWMAVPKRWRSVYHQAMRSLKVTHAGVTMGEVKGKDLVPDQSLALSTALRREAFHNVEVSEKEALAYLRRDTLTLPSDTPRGWVLFTYRGATLGFVKNLGNRTNSLYPTEWKIKSSYGPEKGVEVVSRKKQE